MLKKNWWKPITILVLIFIMFFFISCSNSANNKRDWNNNPLSLPDAPKNTSINKNNYKEYSGYNPKTKTLGISNGISCIDSDTFDFVKTINVETLYLPNSLINIEAHAFDTFAIKNLKLDCQLQFIGDDAFANTQIKELVIPNSVIKISKEAFLLDSQLTTLTFQENSKLTSIGDHAFQYAKIKTLNLPNSITYLRGFDLSEITSLKIPENVEYIGNGAFSSAKFQSLNIPSSVIRIDDYAFQNANHLSSLTFSKTSQLLYIGTWSFASVQINSITIPSSVQTIGYVAFGFAKKLSSITFGKNSHLKTIKNSAFMFANITSLALPDGLIYLSGFDEDKLTTLQIPDSVKYIGDYAFTASNLTSLRLPNNIISVGDQAFMLSTFQFLRLDNNLKYIGKHAFDLTMTDITIPSSVVSIGDWAFSSAMEIPQHITFEGNPATTKLTLGIGVFLHIPISNIIGTNWQNWAQTKYSKSFAPTSI